MTRSGLFLLATIPVLASDWPRYRGPNGSGVSLDKELPADVGPDRNVVWKTAVPKGNSSPVIVQNKVFLTAHEGDQRLVLCLDARTGKELWRRAVPKTRSEVAHPLNGPTTPSIASDGKAVFSFFPEFGIIAHDLAGRERWRTPLGPFQSVQGLASSPIVAANNVILQVDQMADSYVLALDTRTGAQRWRANRSSGFLGSYSTPALYQPAKGPMQVVVAGAKELTGYQASTGERLWWTKGITVGPAALPQVSGDTVYTLEPTQDGAPPSFSMMKSADKNKDGKIQIEEEVSQTDVLYRVMLSIDRHHGNGDGVTESSEWDASFAEAGKGGGFVAVKLGGKGELDASAIRWKYGKGLPYVTSPLLYQNVLYVIRNGGIFTSHNAETGEVIKQGRVKDGAGEYYASPVAADGRIYLIDKDGKIAVVKAGPQWEVLSTADLDEQAIATPAVAGGLLYVRTEKTLFCFGKAAAIPARPRAARWDSLKTGAPVALASRRGGDLDPRGR